MKPVYALAALLLMAPLPGSGPAHAEPAARALAFAPGQTHVRVHGFLRGPQDGIQFLLRARAGQRLRVKVARGGPLVIDVTSPSGRRVGDKGVALALTASETGLYRVSVGENQMAEGGRDLFILDITRRLTSRAARHHAPLDITRR